MPLEPGTRLGPYEILAPLGAGGMGEVFRATDTRLGREVAVKVLPQHLPATPEARARFEREAKAVSSLTHPHICTLHDVGREGETDYLVMELIEGETLSDRLTKGPLPTNEVLELGAQIADALDRAHRAGVMHRDLKPANVMLTKSGAKLMDFGLARATAIGGPPTASGATMATATHSPTLATPLTAEGTILGTFQYMAPEQLEGGESDARSDLWALGCVLYEMATGRRAFEGKSQASLITSIMGSDPTPISQLAPMTPPGLERLVQACLTKDPADRLQSAHDIRMQLEWLAEGGSQAGVPAPVAAKRRSRGRLTGILAATGWLVAIAVAVFALDSVNEPQPEGPFHATVQPVANPANLIGGGPMALSPDGTRIANVVWTDGGRLISVYDFESGEHTILEGTAGAGYPFWSPDSRWIGYFADGKLRKVEARGGPAQMLADAFNGRGGSWSPVGTIIFAPDIYGPMMSVSENGGTATAVTEPDSEDVAHQNPFFLPDGKRFLFTERGTDSNVAGHLMVGSIEGATPREVLERSSNVQLSSGHLLFVRDGNLLAQRFDEKALELSGPIVPVADGVAYWSLRDNGDFSASADGVLVFRRRVETAGGLAWADRSGRLVETLTARETEFRVGVPSRNLQQAGILRRDSSTGTLDVWRLEMATGQMRRVTFTGTDSMLSFAFSPDGRRMAVSVWGESTSAAATQGERDEGSIWIQSVSGAGGQESVLEHRGFYVTEWSPDGNVLLGWTQRTGTSIDLSYIRLDDPEPGVRDLVRTRFREFNPRFSPDGNWVAYHSDESGGQEIYVVDFPDADRKWQVSRDGGRGAIWSRDGGEIFFRRGSDTMVAPVTRTADGIEFGIPVKVDLPEGARQVIGADGERLLVDVMDQAAGGNATQVIRNWSLMLER